MSVHWNWMFVKRSSLSLKCLSADASGKWAKMKKSERDSRIFQRHRRRMASQNTIGYGVSDSRAQQVEKKVGDQLVRQEIQWVVGVMEGGRVGGSLNIRGVALADIFAHFYDFFVVCIDFVAELVFS